MTQEKKPVAGMPDVQSSADSRQIAINKVGIKSIRHPIVVADKAEGVQHTIANFNMYVGTATQLQGHPHVTICRHSQQPVT